MLWYGTVQFGTVECSTVRAGRVGVAGSVRDIKRVRVNRYIIRVMVKKGEYGVHESTRSHTH